MVDIVRATCPTLGNVRMDARRVVLTVGPGGASYRWSCVCGEIHVKACSPRICALLAEVVVVERVELEEHEGPPINGVDIMEFILNLREPGWERELA